MLSLAASEPLFLIVIGLAACFAGYRLFRAMLAVYGFVIGAGITSTFFTGTDTLATVVALSVGGLIGVGLLFAGYHVGVLIAGAGAGLLAANVFWLAYRGVDAGITVLLFGAAIGAALASAFQRHVVVLTTAFVGAHTAVSGALALLATHAASTHSPMLQLARSLRVPPIGRQWSFLAWVLLGSLGCIVQLSSGSRKDSRERK
jgi:hypothetical protein